MRVRAGGERRSGRAIDLTGFDLSGTAVAAAVRTDATPPVVRCPDPGPVHDHVGLIEPGMAIDVRSALAAAARSRGNHPPQADEIERIEDRLAGFEVPDVSLRDARRRVANASGAETELRERVASLRGRVQALRETGANPTDAEAALADATQRLSEVETERIAAEQTLDRAREQLATARDRREERMRLRDRKANLERAARQSLARALRDEFADAVRTVPGEGTVESPSSAFDGDPVTAGLAVARVADLDAPVVLSCDRFRSVDAAADCLDAPVLHV